jgi:small subunit ribosomal protein S20
MPNSEHRKKTLRQDAKRNEMNRARRAALRTAVKQARTGLADDPANAENAVRGAYKRLDKAAKSNLIHPNKAARLKSRLAKAQNAAAKA